MEMNIFQQLIKIIYKLLKWKKISTKNSAEEYYKQYPGYKKAIYNNHFFLSRIVKLKKDLVKIRIKFYFQFLVNGNYTVIIVRILNIFRKIMIWMKTIFYIPKEDFILIAEIRKE